MKSSHLEALEAGERLWALTPLAGPCFSRCPLCNRITWEAQSRRIPGPLSDPLSESREQGSGICILTSIVGDSFHPKVGRDTCLPVSHTCPSLCPSERSRALHPTQRTASPPTTSMLGPLLLLESRQRFRTATNGPGDIARRLQG